MEHVENTVFVSFLSIYFIYFILFTKHCMRAPHFSDLMFDSATERHV